MLKSSFVKVKKKWEERKCNWNWLFNKFCLYKLENEKNEIKISIKLTDNELFSKQGFAMIVTMLRKRFLSS